MQMLASPLSHIPVTRHSTVVNLLLEVDTASGALDADSADGAPADVLDSGDGESLLVVVDGRNDTTDSTALNGSGNDCIALDAEDVEAVADPVEAGVSENEDEADEGDDVGDAGVGSIGDGSLDWGEDGTSRDTHDHDTGTATSVRAKVGSSEGEESRVHGSHEKEDDDKDTDTSNTANGADSGSAGNCEGSVDHKEEVGLEDRGETSGDETTDSEGDQGVRQHLRALRVGNTAILVRIIHEQSSAGNLKKKYKSVKCLRHCGGWQSSISYLSTNVAELSSKAEEQVVLLPDGTSANDVSVGIGGKLESRVVDNGASPLGSRLSNLRQLGEEEHDTDSDTQKSDSQVDILDSLEGVGVLAREEVLGGDKRANEGGNAVPGLAELQTSGGPGWVTDHNGVRVGGGLKGSKTAGNDQSAGEETTERSSCVVGASEVGSRPEEDGTKRVESKTHDDSDLVTLTLEDLSSDGREDEVTTTEVHDLETGRFEPCDSEDILEVLVQDIEKTVRETPEEEERCNKAEREDEPLASQEATLNGGNVHRNSTATHCVG